MIFQCSWFYSHAVNNPWLLLIYEITGVLQTSFCQGSLKNAYIIIYKISNSHKYRPSACYSVVKKNGMSRKTGQPVVFYLSSIYGYLKSVGETKFSLMVRGETHRIILIKEPALSLVPEPLAPPNGCWPTTAPVGLSLI
jgi:hypothetical protein